MYRICACREAVLMSVQLCIRDRLLMKCYTVQKTLDLVPIYHTRTNSRRHGMSEGFFNVPSNRLLKGLSPLCPAF